MKMTKLNKWRNNVWIAKLLNIVDDTNSNHQINDQQLRLLAQDKDDLLAAAEYETLWAMSDELAFDKDLTKELADCEELIQQHSQSKPSAIHQGTIWVAGCCVLALTGVLFFGGIVPSQVMPAHYHTQTGEQRLVTLEDGSQVTLNTDTGISFKMGNIRQVNLIRGEAYFDVAHDPERPFIVNTIAGQAKALGTEFSVRLNNDRTIITVVEGAVAVAGTNALETPPPLTSGESLALLNDGTPTPKQQVDTSAIRYWREGKVYFKDEPLHTSIAEFNRYLDRKLVLSGNALDDIRIGGIFQISDVDGFLFALNEAFGVETIDSPNAIILVKR